MKLTVLLYIMILSNIGFANNSSYVYFDQIIENIELKLEDDININEQLEVEYKNSKIKLYFPNNKIKEEVLNKFQVSEWVELLKQLNLCLISIKEKYILFKIEDAVKLNSLTNYEDCYENFDTIVYAEIKLKYVKEDLARLFYKFVYLDGAYPKAKDSQTISMISFKSKIDKFVEMIKKIDIAYE